MSLKGDPHPSVVFGLDSFELCKTLFFFFFFFLNEKWFSWLDNYWMEWTLVIKKSVYTDCKLYKNQLLM